MIRRRIINCINWFHYRKYHRKHGWYGQRWYEDGDGNIYWKYMHAAPSKLTEKRDAMQWFFDEANKEVSNCKHYSQPDRLRKKRNHGKKKR